MENTISTDYAYVTSIIPLKLSPFSKSDLKRNFKLLTVVLCLLTSIQSVAGQKTAERKMSFASAKPIPLPAVFAPNEISTGGYESHPAFTPDGRTRYFLQSTPDFNFWTIVSSHLERGIGARRRSRPSPVNIQMLTVYHRRRQADIHHFQTTSEFREFSKRCREIGYLGSVGWYKNIGCWPRSASKSKSKVRLSSRSMR